MPHYLYLLRHGQSAEKQVGQADKDRELTSTGIKQASSIGKYILKEKLKIDYIVSSTALRAKATAQMIVDTNKIDLEKFILEDELYEASTRTFLEFINALEDDNQNVLCVGHNPVISYLAEYLTKSEIGDMDTAGLVIIKFKSNFWKEVGTGTGELVNYVFPEMLLND